MARTIGIDTGGTFTDLAAVTPQRHGNPDEVAIVKTPSTPADPGAAVVRALECVGGTRAGDRVVHGTTVALNALLTGNLAPVALVTNAGFEDLVEIGRQERPDIYALHPVKPRALVERARRFGIGQRLWPDPDGRGFVTVREPTGEELAQLTRRVAKSGADSVAVCLLHSWADPSIEERVAEPLRALGLPLTLSAALLREHREFERFSTALVNASLVPLMRAYLERLDARLGRARLELLQSSGGTLSAARAAQEPVRVLLSGPAGGVVGAAQAAFEAGLGAFCALDMGGTSTDVAFHDGREKGEGEGEALLHRRPVEPVRIAGHPITVPTMDIHTIGCGGGSLVEVDGAGVLHVGPKSAGADPGPVAYGQSDRLTLTDAHVFLGHVREGAFLDGALPLHADAVAHAFEDLGARLGVSALEAARGVVEVARAGVRRAIGVMTMQRGRDPEGLPLVAFGGAGGLHAAALAQSLGMRAALVPFHPGALSARGMCTARPLADAARAVLEPFEAWNARRRREARRELTREARAKLAGARRGGRVVLEHSLDLRYRGQSFEIGVVEQRDVAEGFHRAHEALYGYRLEREIELVCLRTRAVVTTEETRPGRPRRRSLPAGARHGRSRAVFAGSRRAHQTELIARAALAPGHAFEGPALVEEYSGTTLVPPGWQAFVTAGAHLLLTRG